MFAYPKLACPECDGEGRYEVLNSHQSPTAYEPATHMEWCEVCEGTGRLDYEWCSAQDDLPAVGERVLVVGKTDGAPDSPLTALEDELVDEGDPTRPPRWKHGVDVREWASL